MKFLIIFVVIFANANVHAAPSPAPNADFFGIFDELLDYFFESDEEDVNFNNQTINVNCFNCTVQHAASQGSETTTTAVPITTSGTVTPASGTVTPASGTVTPASGTVTPASGTITTTTVDPMATTTVDPMATTTVDPMLVTPTTLIPASG